MQKARSIYSDTFFIRPVTPDCGYKVKYFIISILQHPESLTITQEQLANI